MLKFEQSRPYSRTQLYTRKQFTGTYNMGMAKENSRLFRKINHPL